jgi:hypothetical protein
MGGNEDAPVGDAWVGPDRPTSAALDALVVAPDPAMPDPRFVIIGTQKGGTHWLRANLSAHPEIFMPTEELNHFTFPTRAERLGIEGYRSQFTGWGGEPVIGEATPGYMIWKHRPAVMARAIDRVLPDVRLVAILRNPVDRSQSALTHFRRQGRADPPDADLLEMVARHDPSTDHLCLISGSWYAASLRPYLDLFGDRLLVVLNDDIAHDAAGLYRRLLDHLGADPSFRPTGLTDRLFSYDSRKYGLAPLTPRQRAIVFEFFRRDIEELETMIDRDLSHWTPTR